MSRCRGSIRSAAARFESSSCGCAIAAARCFSVRTCWPMRRPSAAVWPSWPEGGWPRWANSPTWLHSKCAGGSSWSRASALQHSSMPGGAARLVRVTSLGEERYALELPLSVAPDQVLTSLTARGARLVSLNPIRETLEDFFVRQVGAVPHDRGLELNRAG